MKVIIQKKIKCENQSSFIPKYKHIGIIEFNNEVFDYEFTYNPEIKDDIIMSGFYYKIDIDVEKELLCLLKNNAYNYVINLYMDKIQKEEPNLTEKECYNRVVYMFESRHLPTINDDNFFDRIEYIDEII